MLICSCNFLSTFPILISKVYIFFPKVILRHFCTSESCSIRRFVVFNLSSSSSCLAINLIPCFKMFFYVFSDFFPKVFIFKRKYFSGDSKEGAELSWKPALRFDVATVNYYLTFLNSVVQSFSLVMFNILLFFPIISNL